MQLSPPNIPPITPQTTASTLLPRELQVTRIGKGTVASEIDRSIRLRFEGTGPIAGRTVVPDSRAARELYAAGHGATLEKAVRSFSSIVDAHQGNEDLKTVSFLPDEHASKGVSILNWAHQVAGAGYSIDDVIEPTRADLGRAQKQFPDVPRAELRAALRQHAAAEVAKQLAEGEAENVSFAAAWNGAGHISVMPDVSRELFATLGLYRLQPGDETQQVPPAKREQWGKAAWHTMVHEVHHSISPMDKRGPEWTSVMEEAVPEVLSPSDAHHAMVKAGADTSLIARPARDTKHEPVDWPAWNRKHLPKPPKDQMDTAEGRYTSGPELLRELLSMANIDRRTTAGKAATLELLQGRDAKFVPRRVADAIVSERGLPAAQAPELADLIRQAAIGKATLAEIKAFIGA